MANSIMKIGPGRNEARRVFMNVMEQESDKKGFPVWLNEIVGGNKLPGHKATMFLNGDQPNKQWFEISGPIRRMNEAGEYLFEARKNQEGAFLNEKGDVVENEQDAAKQYVYVKDSNDNIVMGKLGTVNVINTRKDKETGNIVPSKSTYLSAKLYTDKEAYLMAQTLYRYKHSSGEKKDEFLAQLNEEQKKFGSFNNMFVNSGGEFLKSLGFEVRIQDSSNTYSNG